MSSSVDTITRPAARRKGRGEGRAGGRASAPRQDTPASSRPRSLGRNFTWLAVGNVATAACAWGRLVVLARLGNAEMIGQLTLAFALCNPITTLADLGLGGVLVTDVQGRYRFADYLGLRLVTSLLAVLAAACMAWGGGYDAATARLILMAGIAVALESVGDIFRAVLERCERMDQVAQSLLVRGPLGLALLTLLTWTTGDLAWGVCGFSVAALATMLAMDAPRAFVAIPPLPLLPHRQAGEGTERKAHSLLSLAWLSLPMGLAALGMALTTSIPRCLVGHYLGHEALGGFAVAGGLMVAMSLVVGTMSQTAGPRLARLYASADLRRFTLLLGGLLGWTALTGGVAVVVMAMTGRPILGLLYGSHFAQYADLATCLMLAAALRNLSVPLGRAISSTQSFWTSLAVRLLGILAIAGFSAALIPGGGLMGAAWAIAMGWLITSLLSAVALSWILWKTRPDRIR